LRLFGRLGPVFFGALTLAAGLIASILLAACGAPEPRVARGEAVSTGIMAYDDFFNAVRDLRNDAQSAPQAEQAPRAKLSTALGVDPAGPLSQTVQASGERAHKLFAEHGIQLHLELVPDARLLATRGKGDGGADAEAVLKAMEEAARSSLDTRKKLETIAGRAAELEKRRASLRDEAPQAFHDMPAAKRAEVIAELDAAAAVLASSGEAANRSAGAVSRFVVDLAQAVETGGAVALVEASKGRGARRPPPAAIAPPPPPPPSPPPVAVASAPPKPAVKPASAPASPPPPPAKKGKKPKGGDDFEP
jgi:hypothetical protein